jgi:hypothetical protein
VECGLRKPVLSDGRSGFDGHAGRSEEHWLYGWCG